MLSTLFTMLALLPATSPVPANQIAPEVCEHRGPVAAAAVYRSNYVAECQDGNVFAFSSDGKSHIPAGDLHSDKPGRTENDTILTAFVPPHRQLSACRRHYFDRESVSIGGRDLKVTWNKFHDVELYHYGRKTVTFNGVTFTNNTSKTAYITATIERI